MGGERASRAASVSVSAICDAMGRARTHRCHIAGLVSPSPERRLAGPVVTMRFLPLRTDLVDPARHEFGALLRDALAGRPDGRVLVASSAGHPGGALAGGKKLARIRNLGLDGIVCDGSLRDFVEAVALGIGAWCVGETIRNANDLLMPYEVNVAVEVAGVTAVPGDWVFADASGAVVVPEVDVDAVLDAAVGIESHDLGEVARAAAADAEWLAGR